MVTERLSQVDRINQLLNAIRYRYRLILFVLATVFGTTLCYVLRMPDVYRSETQILVNPQRVSDKYVSTVVTMDASERLNTLSQQILSSSRLEKILDEFRLFPKLRGELSREELIDRMRKNIGIELKHNADGLSAFTLSYTGDSAEQVAAVANRLAESFISWNLHDREQEALGTTAFLANELSASKVQLDGLEEQIRSYKMRHLGELPDQLQANMQTLSRLQVELQGNNEAQSRLDHEVLLTSTLTPRSTSPKAPASMITLRQKLINDRNAAQTELEELRKQYKDGFPDVLRKQAEIRALDDRIESLPEPAPVTTAEAIGDSTDPRLQLLRRDRTRLINDQYRIQAAIQRYQARIDSEPVREQELAQLLRDYDTSRDHHRSLLEKSYSAEMAAQLERQQQGGSFTMLDHARVPEAPIGPKRLPLLFGALLLSLTAGLLTAFLAEAMDKTVKSESDLRECLPDVPILGVTPDMRRVPGAHRNTLVLTRALLGGN